MTFFLKSVFATLALPFFGAILLSSYSLMYIPSLNVSEMHSRYLYYFSLFALFSIPTALNNSLCYSIASGLHLLRWWFFVLLSGSSLALFYSLLVIDMDFWNRVRHMGIYGLFLGIGSGSFFYWFFLRKKHKNKVMSLEQHAHYRLHLTYISVMFLVCKLKLANYRPPSDIAVFLAVRPGFGFDSYISKSPAQSQYILLRDENSYVGERYFDFIFNWGWWLFPSILLVFYVIKYLQRK